MTQTGFGRFIDEATLQYERIFPHPVERVWRAITEPAEVVAWFEPISLELAVGGAWRLGAGGGWAGTITALEPLRCVRFDHAAGRPDCDPGAYFQFELEPVVGGTRMLFTHHLPGVAGGLARDPNGVAGGWHELFDGLTEWLNGVAVGARLPKTDLARTVEAWADAKVLDGEFEAETARRHVLDLRREEEVAQLNRRYRERKSASAAGQGDAGLGRFLDRRTLEFVRVYPHPIERVWRAITDPAELARWFIPTTTWEFQEGGAYRFHDDGMSGAITAIDAPRFIRFSAGAASGRPGSFFQYELTPVEGGTRLRFVEHAAPGPTWEMQPRGRRDVPWAGGNLGGWHEFWDALAAHLDGVPADSRLPPTPMSALVADWVSGVQVSYNMDKRLGARIRIGLRRKERWAELNALYEKVIDETLPPA